MFIYKLTNNRLEIIDSYIGLRYNNGWLSKGSHYNFKFVLVKVFHEPNARHFEYKVKLEINGRPLL